MKRHHPDLVADVVTAFERSFDRAWKKATREARRITLSAPIYKGAAPSDATGRALNVNARLRWGR